MGLTAAEILFGHSSSICNLPICWNISDSLA
jgi:hypothetical protein